MSKAVRILLHIAGTLVCILLTSAILGLFSCSSKSESFRVLSDAFFITGGLFCGVGIISFAIKEGAFDTIGKAALRKEEGQTIEEYNRKKQGKRKWFGILTSCGVCCMVIAFVFTCLC